MTATTSALAGFDAQIEGVNGTLATVRAEMAGLDNIRKRYNRAFSPAEAKRFDDAEEKHRQCELRIEELIVQREREVAASEANQRYGLSRAYVTREAGPYRQDGEFSFFADMLAARQFGDHDAAQRLAHNNKARLSTRALSTTTGAIGEFVPPAWLEDDFIAAVRPARATADILTLLDLPSGTDVLNLPKLASGTSTAIQTAQNTALSQTDAVSTSVSAGVFTLAGTQVLSQQLFDQSPIRGHIDRVILADLSADYAKQIGSYVLNGTGTNQPVGLLALSGTTAITYTDASPALMGPGKLYSKIAQGIQAIQTSRFMSATHVVMHPRRWAWAAVQVDSSNRPAVLPDTNGPFNASGVQTSSDAQGVAGHMFGLPVVLDPNIGTSGGGGSNQDSILILRASDSWL